MYNLKNYPAVMERWISRVPLKLGLFVWVSLIFILLIRVPLATIPFFNVDEGSSAVIGNTMVDGGLMYRDAADGRGPIVYFAYAAIFSLFGKGNMTAAHLVLACLIFLTAFILYLSTDLIYGSKAIPWTALFFGVFSYVPGIRDKLAFHAEWLSIFFTSLGGYFFLKHMVRGRTFLLLLCGLSFGLAFFSKQLSFFDYAATLMSCGIFAAVGKGGCKRSIKDLAASVVGFLAIAWAIVIYFHAHNALKDFWFYFWEYYNHYYLSNATLFERLRVVLTSRLFLGIYILGVLVFYLDRRFAPEPKKTKILLMDLYVLLWFIFSYIGASYSGRGFEHYYIMLIPPLSLLCSHAAQTILYCLSLYQKPGRNLLQGMVSISSRAKIRLAAVFMLLGVLSLLFLYAQRYRLKDFYFTTFSEESFSSTDGRFNELAAYIKEHSAPQQKILVWGFHPEIYILAQRPCASRYIYSCFLTGLMPWINHSPEIDTSQAIVRGSWKVFLDELRMAKPVYIVDTAVPTDTMAFGKYPPGKFKELFSFMHDNYVHERDFLDRFGFIACRLFKRADTNSFR